jgi:hypothetical protein
MCYYDYNYNYFYNYHQEMVAFIITITTTVSNGTITIPVLNRNCYVRNLCSIEKKANLTSGRANSA